MNHSAFFGDGDYTFALTDDMVAELERLSEMGIGALFLKIFKQEFHLGHLTQIIRLSLIGGGASPEQAMNLISTYGRNRPIEELLPLVLDILDARWNSPQSEGVAE